MNNTENEIQQLLLKYREGKCTPQELNRLYQIYNLASNSAGESQPTLGLDEVGNDIWSRLPAAGLQQDVTTSKVRIHLLGSAAAILFFALLSGLFYLLQHQDAHFGKRLKSEDLAPGRNAATLTLSNGKKVFLSDMTNERFKEQNGVSIVKEKSGQLVYQIKAKAKTNKLNFNTLSTANGQQYQVQLPDGTMVWLNAGSSLTYPTLFKNSHERVVMLKGEAYFEVASNRDFNGHKNPFIVRTDREEVKVLGTHFNVNSYSDESEVKTTLLEGSIELNIKNGNYGRIILRPKEQSSLILANNQVAVKLLDDAESEIAWKQGLFHFDHTQIKAVMRELARWYNVDVLYKGAIPNAFFTGEMYKNLSASQVLEGLSYTGLHFTIKEHQIIVTN
jgi:transmembrane sensor